MFHLVEATRPDPYARKVHHINGGSDVEINRWMGGCGMGFMRNLMYAPANRDDYRTLAAWIATVYKELHGPGHTLYTLADSALTCPFHEAMLLIGAQELASWPNLYHGPNIIHLFKVNIRDAVGVFCNEYGEPYEVMPEVLPPRKEHSAPKGQNDYEYPYAEFPKRNKNEQPTAHPAV